MKLVQIYKDGKMEDIEIKASPKTIIKKLEKVAKDRGSCEIRELYTWKYDTKLIICLGWTEGDQGNMNVHSLITDGYSKYLDQNSSEIKLYGDIFICCTERDKYKDLDILEYGEFYTNNNIYNEEDTDSSDYEEEEIVDGENENCLYNFKKSEKSYNNIKKLARDMSTYE